jgi:hypothetical protein
MYSARMLCGVQCGSSRERRVQPRRFGRPVSAVGVGQRQEGVALARGMLRRLVDGLHAQADHAHEQQHVEGGAELERVQVQ